MEITLKKLHEVAGLVLAEARKKTEKSVRAKYEPRPAAYGYAESFDFSQPLGAYSLYRSQGASNWGPMTGPGTSVDDAIAPGAAPVRESRGPWEFLSETLDPRAPRTIWEAAAHWYDHQGLGLGSQTQEGIAEKKLGFARLKSKLAHRKGVTDPAALAASIGRKKLGSREMARRSAAGRKK